MISTIDSLPLELLDIVLSSLLTFSGPLHLSAFLSANPTAFRLFQERHCTFLTSHVEHLKSRLHWLLDPALSGHKTWHGPEQFQEVKETADALARWCKYRERWLYIPERNVRLGDADLLAWKSKIQFWGDSELRDGPREDAQYDDDED